MKLSALKLSNMEHLDSVMALKFQSLTDLSYVPRDSECIFHILKASNLAYKIYGLESAKSGELKGPKTLRFWDF